MRVSRVLPFVAALLLFYAPARAQGPFESPRGAFEAAQMSSRTGFYLIWRGAPSPQVRKENSLLALWDDGDFAAVRTALAADILNSSGNQSSQAKFTAEQIQEFAALLENSFTAGYLSAPGKRGVSNGDASPGTKAPPWNGMFFVSDRSGKEALLSKAIVGMRATEKDAPVLSQVTIGGVEVLKVESKNGASYWAERGKFAVGASERSVMEEILGRLDGKIPGEGRLTQSAAYQEAQPNLGSGVLEFFLRVPDLENIVFDSNGGVLQARKLLDAAKLDAVHSISGHVTLEGAKTHIQAALLGDAVPGTPFDIWPTGQNSPVSLGLVPADAVFYHSTQFNFSGIYDTVKRVARAAFPQASQGNADLIETVAQQRLGMPAAEAIGLFTGEVATLQTSPSMEGAKLAYFFGIRKKPEILKLFRTVFSDQLSSERNEGDVTFLKVSFGGKQGAAGSALWNFFNLAVTPDMIIGASRMDTLREVLANRAKGPATVEVAAVTRFQSNRAHFPENLNSRSFLDFQKIDWAGWRDRLAEEAKNSSAVKNADGSKASAPPAGLDWLRQINPQVLSRHLHYSSSVSWKDSKGMHWDQWVE